MRYIRIILLALIVFSGLEGCKQSGLKNLDEGEIHYSIKYTGRQGTVSESLMPDNMIVRFRNNRILMEIVSPVGNNGIFTLIDQENNTMETFISLIGMRYVYRGVVGEIPPGIDPMSDMIIEKTTRTKEMFGLECKHAIARVPGTDFSFDLWYTSEIKLHNPNVSTPFSSIDGVLMLFFYRMGDVLVEFEAQGIYNRTISDKEFDIGDKYREIERAPMHSIISRIINL
ncbi:MAG: hypothetical protein LC649_05910 [Bacteroidales bacterium]|nr:hypothetical protein [Bacteroidales bacterium]